MAKHRQPVIQAAPAILATQAQATSYTRTQAQATSYTGSASYTGNAIIGNQLYQQRNHRQTLKALIGFLK